MGPTKRLNESWLARARAENLSINGWELFNNLSTARCGSYLLVTDSAGPKGEGGHKWDIKKLRANDLGAGGFDR